MSDGPHRSLPMERLWKGFGKRAETKLLPIDEVSRHGERALLATLRKDLPRRLLREVEQCLANRQTLLNGNVASLALLERLKRTHQEGRLSGPFIDYAILATLDGQHGERAACEALQRVVDYEADNRRRQIAEHYLRSSWSGTPAALRRVDAALAALDSKKLAAKLVGRGDDVTLKAGPKASLDDGVPVLGASG